MRRLFGRIDAVLVQAVIAGALSFAHLQEIAEAAGQTGWKSWAYPISVDLLLVAAWRRLRTLKASGNAVRAAWFWFVVALAASLGANIATAGLLDLDHVPNWLRILVAGWPALAFLGGTLLVHAPAATTEEPAAATKTEFDVQQVEAPAPVESPAAVESSPTPALSAPEPQPEVVSSETPKPALVQGPAPAPVVPVALVEHARKVADAHQSRTGSPIDTDTLRARLGVPPVLADQIAAQLA